MLLLIAGWGLLAVLAVAALRPEPQHAWMIGSGPRTGSADVGGLWALLRFVPFRYLPTALALLLALAAWPLVAMTLGTTTGAGSLQGDQPPATFLGQWSAAASAVFISAFVAGTIGARAVRRHAVLGGVFTFLLALVVAVPAVPLLPALLGQCVGVGRVCFDVCSEMTGTRNLGDGMASDLFFVFAPFYEPLPVLTLAAGVVIWTRLVRRLPDR